MLCRAGHSTSQTQRGPEHLSHPSSTLPHHDQALTLCPWCPSQVARSVSVHGHGYLTLALKDVPGLRDFYSGFSFRTSQHEGLLYHHTTQVGTCSGAESSSALGMVLLCLWKSEILVGAGAEYTVRSVS